MFTRMCDQDIRAGEDDRFAFSAEFANSPGCSGHKGSDRLPFSVRCAQVEMAGGTGGRWSGNRSKRCVGDKVARLRARLAA